MRKHINVCFVVIILFFLIFFIFKDKSEKVEKYEEVEDGIFIYRFYDCLKYKKIIQKGCDYWKNTILNTHKIILEIKTSNDENEVLIDTTILSSNENNLTDKALLVINIEPFDDLDEDDKIITVRHEVCHALGFGLKWIISYSELDGPYLSSQDFPLTYNAYSSITGINYITIGVPVENSGGRGVSSIHWENNDREMSEGISKGIPDDLMIASLNNPPVISILTLENLKDLGWSLKETNVGSIDFSLPRTIFPKFLF